MQRVYLLVSWTAMLRFCLPYLTLVHSHHIIASQEFDRAILPLPFLTLEETDGNEPDPHDSGRGFPNPSLVIGVEITLLLHPLAQSPLPGTNRHMGLPPLPGRNWTTKSRFRRQLGAPEVRQVLPIVELDRDA